MSGGLVVVVVGAAVALAVAIGVVARRTWRLRERTRELAAEVERQRATLAQQARRLEELSDGEDAAPQLRELNRMKGEFVAVVSHELRTPVTALIGYAKTLQHPEFSEDPAMRKEFLERMVRQGDRLLRLVENLLTASRIENRQLPLQTGPVLFEDLVREVVEGLGTPPGRVALAIPGDLPVIHTDRQLLGRVIQNLLDNAMKYSPDDSVCEVGARAEGDRVVFWVRDHGIGIPQEELPRIFDRFYQIDSSSTRTFRGTGLGLSLVQDLLGHLGGSIQVESRVDEGSVFTVTLPAHHPDPSGRTPSRPSIPSDLLASG
ncbi:MAG: sensor histidine kinase [Candidatus Velamenicoccus archaeovorus]